MAWLVDKFSGSDTEVIAPPAVVSGLTLWGVSLQDWVYVLTCVYLLVMITKSLYGVIKKWRGKDD